MDFYYFVLNHPLLDTFLLAISFLIIVAIYDITQKKHIILHNFPIVGHLRYFLEMIGPELRQYWVANDKEESPFNRSERSWIYATAKGSNNNFGFGTSEEISSIGYPIIKNAAIPFPDDKAVYLNNDSTAIPCLKIIGETHKRKKPYRPKSIINISAMSFGSLGYKAISSLNKGAKLANCYHNTGEGGLSTYHCHGADIVWQIGTGYFGARDEKGNFSLDILAEKVERYPFIKAIEIKLSQGAKPGKGGILPAKKVTKEVSEIRGIPIGKDCISPNAHKEFSTPDELINFVEKIAERTGLPVGIKAAVGKTDFWEELAIKMKERNQGPDFITIDGGEGGTGAAPLTFSDHVSLPFKIAFKRVYNIFQKEGISKDIVWIGSGKLGFPDRAVIALAMGCDLINIARESMISIGCIQAQKCHTDHCPAGIATQNKWFQGGVDIEDKKDRFARYVKGLRKEMLSLAHTAGYEHPSQFTGNDIEFSVGVNLFKTLEDVMEYKKDEVIFTKMGDYN
ncbi:MAG: FMN-binding glutamate synthase family protein [Candidatus Sericytochromatia bacterium]